VRLPEKILQTRNSSACRAIRTDTKNSFSYFKKPGNRFFTFVALLHNADPSRDEKNTVRGKRTGETPAAFSQKSYTSLV
jgi:hypothetical protein